jgi:phytoene synthase
MRTDPLIKQGYKDARRITQTHAKTFFTASLFLPHAQKQAAYAVYAVCRLSDDSVDGYRKNPTHQLACIHGDIADAYGTKHLDIPLLAAFRETITTYGIPKRYFDLLLEGMKMDIEKKRYADFNELYDYCYKVAGIVGLMMLKIFSLNGPSAEKHAVELGIAMQLTNILRDIHEDLARGRIYLPMDELKEYAVSENDLMKSRLTPAFTRYMAFQVKRARAYYQKALEGIPLIKQRKSTTVVLLMHRLYSAILDVIEQKNYDIFSSRAFVPFWKKVAYSVPILRRKP